MAAAQLPARCFIAQEPRTSPYPDPSLHFPTRADAENAIDGLGIGGARVEQWAEPCWLAKCSTCGATLGTDDLDEAHYDSREEAERHAAAIDDHCVDD